MDNAVKLAPFILSKEVPYGEIYITNLHRAFLVARGRFFQPCSLLACIASGIVMRGVV